MQFFGREKHLKKIQNVLEMTLHQKSDIKIAASSFEMIAECIY